MSSHLKEQRIFSNLQIKEISEEESELFCEGITYFLGAMFYPKKIEFEIEDEN